ncbi:hypothetical protein CKO28_20525 [Rhodovibrio sodomensis]|uniref:HD domain-containing protein n=1 Tax=Rhodovibrio sodomensis TaxID=1088 RepID=A0ABS1DLP4_9PROT|nr:HD domain-containing protein [Rhodovibrio sodomensis]MBK1670413.1 hypothetical protein [Rhodovibrio sodomensis]
MQTVQTRLPIDQTRPYRALEMRLTARGWSLALQAMHFAARHHQGLRKDGRTPEFFHQIWIARYLLSIERTLEHPELTVTVALLHDVTEDYPVTLAQIAELFGAEVAEAVRLLDKTSAGPHTRIGDYYQQMRASAVASVVKGVDRMHNLHSMTGVFAPAKQISYAEEAKELVVPMLNDAAHAHDHQAPAYETILRTLARQIAATQSRWRGAAQPA